MANQFPEESVEIIRKVVHNHLALYSANTKTLYQMGKMIANTFFGSSYGFAYNLKTGYYAPYPHERNKEDVHSLNCTTIIPYLYLYSQILGLKPEIVQFYNFKDIEKPEDKKNTLSPQHFSVIIDVGRKQKYLLDPFYDKFGPIINEGNKYLTLGEGKSKKARREFSRMVHYSLEEFVALLEHVRTPAGSLDMLVAGQKVFENRTIAKCSTTVMIYYDDHANTISTRLYIPQAAITDKAIYCRMPLTDNGKVTTLSLELYLAKKSSWTDLVEKKRIATVHFSDLYAIKRTLKDITISVTIKKTLKNMAVSVAGTEKERRLQRYDRIGAVLLQSKEKRQSLLELADIIYEGLASWEKRKLEPFLLMRALYECTSPEKEYLYSEKDHDKQLLELIHKDYAIIKEKGPLDKILYLHGWKLPRLDLNRARQLKRQEERILNEKIKIVKDIDVLNLFRKNDTKMYHRTMDKVLFAQELGDTDLQEKVAEYGFDPRMGYFAMVWDFIPFALEGKKDLTLELFRDSIAGKVKARRQSYSNGTESVALITDKIAQTAPETMVALLPGNI